MESLPVGLETTNEDGHNNSEESQDHLIKPIEKHVIHKICSGQVRKLSPDWNRLFIKSV